MKLYLIVAIATLASVGCNAEPSERTNRNTAQALTTISAGREYRHDISRSRFHTGTGLLQTTEGGLLKFQGSDGVFAVHQNTGAVLAIPNGDSPATTIGPLTSDETIHNNATLDYFSKAGLPMDEVSGVDVTTDMATDAERRTGKPVRTRFVAYSSHLERSIAGICGQVI
jgi:hypothetical protein